ncbi:GlxA family transcriptional regulator [Moraxella oblonga]|uniref:GlxA family transcriptional regulator n=1 Tax=Moraxella oblonga TaxID=200413 RepID=UPI000832AF51|nr:helix-turn-helix domain-containing protein [Moraxella oblonga]
MTIPPTLTLYAQNGCNDFVFNIPFSIFQTPYQGKKLFDFQVVSDNGKAIRTELGTTITPHGNLDLMDNADIIVLAGWVGDKPSHTFTQKLQTAHQNGKKIIALCYGTFGLAFADILTDKTVVTHWAGENAFKQQFPHIKLDNNKLYLDDGNILTSAGAYAGMDCCLYFIRMLYRASVANDLARLFVSAPHREGGQAQFSQLSIVNHTKDSKINALLQFLSDNLDKTHKLDDLADKVHLSKRSFNRYFKNATNMTLTQWLTAKRLSVVQELLESSDESIERIAQKSGFGSASHLREKFKERFGVSPQVWRRGFGG